MVRSMPKKNRNPLALCMASLIAGSLAASLAIASVGPGAKAPADIRSAEPAQNLQTLVNDSMGLIRSELIQLDLDPTPGRPVDVQLPIDGELLTLHLEPNSVRAPEYRVSVQLDDGSLVPVEPSPVNTLVGWSDELPGLTAAASLTEEGLRGVLTMPDGTKYAFEPVDATIQGVQAGAHVVYGSHDVIPHGGTCGATDAFLNQAENIVEALEGDAAAGGAGAGDEVCHLTQIAADADFAYYQTFGASVINVENRINLIINTINEQYESQVGIRHEITEIVVRTSAASNPYSTTNAGVLLSQFSNVWATAPENQIKRDVAHLFTGNDLQGTTIGIAWLGTICQSPSGQGYSLSQHLTQFSCMTDLTAHEIGHNWSAPHCNCPSFTMNPGLTCANNFSAGTINQIIAFRDTRTCLTDCFEPLPNETCSNATLVSNGSFPYNNLGATTDGPDEPSLCDFVGETQVNADVWFQYVATCTGEATFSLCQSDYPTKLAVYADSCPDGPGEVIACDLSSCAENTRSTITIPVSEGEQFYIRVGGRFGAQGEGILDIGCGVATDPCVGDLNGDETVDVLDLLAVLGDWGACPGCDTDLNGDDNVNVLDLLELLGAWGACE